MPAFELDITLKIIFAKGAKHCASIPGGKTVVVTVANIKDLGG